MATELQQALLEAGGDTSLCDLCRPSVEGHTPHIGLREREAKNNLNNRIQLENRLSDIIDAANQCWVCGWLLLLFKNRQPEIFAGILPLNYERVHLGIGPHCINSLERSKTHSDAYKSKRELVRIYFSVDLRNISGPLNYFLYLQQSGQQAMNLTSLLDQTNSLEWPTHKPFEARIRPSEADMRLCRQWKDHCIKYHSGVCDNIKVDEISSIRLVDVKLKCIVNIPANVPWVALSYCWEEQQKNTLLNDNLAAYETPGALTEEILPPVIFDALIATGALGERYIWIDSLCIVQDDELDKAKYLPVMDKIYAHAILTIINADGSDTSSGLPGIRHSIRRRTQQQFELNGVWVTEALDPVSHSHSGYLSRCKWSTRGWTFQEGLLSRRCLIFTADQIYWQCQNSTWCEGSFWERTDDLQIYRHFHNSNILTSLADPVIENWTQLYITILEGYVQRKFRFESDVMHAVNGVLRAVKQSTGEDHFWGLPINILERSLAWIASAGPSRRKLQHKYIDSGGKLKSCPFPSWSWVGWLHSSISLRVLNPSITTGTLGLRFYRLDDKGDPTPLLETWPPLADEITHDDKFHGIRYPPSATHPWLDIAHQTITSADIPPFLASSPLAPSLLCFWTSVATLRIDQRGWNGYWDEPYIVLCDPDGDTKMAGRWLFGGFDREPQREQKLNLPEYGKFIVVGATRQRMSHGGALTLTLMMVEMGADDGELEAVASVACRRSHLVTEIMEALWEKLQGTKKWELVFLY